MTTRVASANRVMLIILVLSFVKGSPKLMTMR
jgi:hypothetical protein